MADVIATLAHGEAYRARVSATSHAGLTAEATAEFTVDLTPPTVAPVRVDGICKANATLGCSWGGAADDLAFLQYTSGSTSEPKGVMISHGNLAHNLSTIVAALGADQDTSCVAWLPQYHDMGLIGSFLGVVCVADFARSARRPMSISLTHTLAWPQPVRYLPVL